MSLLIVLQSFKLFLVGVFNVASLLFYFGNLTIIVTLFYWWLSGSLVNSRVSSTSDFSSRLCLFGPLNWPHFDIWYFLIFDTFWYLILFDIWYFLIFDTFWYLILFDIWYFLIFDTFWYLIHFDIWYFFVFSFKVSGEFGHYFSSPFGNILIFSFVKVFLLLERRHLLCLFLLLNLYDRLPSLFFFSHSNVVDIFFRFSFALQLFA